ncbi:MAG: alpha/beta hydrolase [Roseovarius sp.]|nr:alpha/beta hydrolase [Roseovarius sp.]
MPAAPYLADLADAPDDGQTLWLTAEDGVRLRIGVFNKQAAKGTVLLFPGRTEYIEKYGRAASSLAQQGYATLTIDWRGQGLADRLSDDPMSGHVDVFSDYQLDVAAMVGAATKLNLPKPWHLLAHSMGGCIGLRSLYLGLPVQSAVFSGPMWGIRIAPALRPMAWLLSWASRHVGMDHAYAPGTAPETYVLEEPFESNKLTNDRDMYQYMVNQARAWPDVGLGGPSLRWLYEALKETRDLSRLPSPEYPCLTFTGTEEDIVHVPRITERMDKWPGSEMEWIDGGKHETLMESAATQARIFSRIGAFYERHSDAELSPAPHAASGGQGR